MILNNYQDTYDRLRGEAVDKIASDGAVPTVKPLVPNTYDLKDSGWDVMTERLIYPPRKDRIVRAWKLFSNEYDIQLKELMRKQCVNNTIQEIDEAAARYEKDAIIMVSLPIISIAIAIIAAIIARLMGAI